MVWVWGRAWRAHCLRLTKPMLQKGKKPQKLQVGAVALGVRQSGGDVSARGPSAAVDEIATSSTDWPFSVGFLDRIATFLTDFAVGPGVWGRNLQVDWLLFLVPGLERVETGRESRNPVHGSPPDPPNRSRKSRSCPLWEAVGGWQVLLSVVWSCRDQWLFWAEVAALRFRACYSWLPTSPCTTASSSSREVTPSLR